MASGTRLTHKERGLDQLDPGRIRELFSEDSPLSPTVPGYEYRSAQQQMALAVAEGFRSGGELLVEAGTGTGKTLAYLVPAVLSGQRVVVSTGTKNLQEQLYYKDIPLLRKALGIPFAACLMKGRGNYLCLARYGEFGSQPAFRIFEEAEHFDTLRKWAEITKSGDRSEIPGVPERLDFWKGISARNENCSGRDCPDFDRCYVTRLRQRAAESDIIVVNHHLLLADLIVREGSFGEVIPEYDYLILDEAHQVEDVATAYFGLAVSTARVEELVRDAEKAWKSRGAGRGGRARADLSRLRHAGQALFESYRAGEERYRIRPGTTTSVQERVIESFHHALEKVRGDLASIPNPDDVTVSLQRRAGEIGQDLEVILRASDPESVSWCERRERSIALRSSPINVAPMLRQTLLEKKRTVVLTSATLAVEKSFDYVRARLGVAGERQHILPSPFDFRRQALLYVPRHLPPPRDRSFLPKAVEEIRALLSASRGRAFVLFTSFANLNAVRKSLGGRALPYPLLVQGEASRSEVLDRFRATDGAVLLATSSFWEGVDVVGDSLSCVIIDKLPFAVPGDPLISARIDFVEGTGGSGFHDYQVPMAILSLKQGLGRLIRSTGDRGVVAILDSRVATMGYGRRFLESLPPYRLSHDRADVFRFFEGGGESDG